MKYRLNILLEELREMYNTSTRLLSQFENRVEKSRELFLDSLKELPEGLQTVARTRTLERIERASHKMLLGEYAPWLVADLLGVTDEQSVKEVSASWLNLYFFVMMLDDVIDRRNDGEYGAAELITASLLLQRGISELSSLLSESTEFKESFDSAFMSTANAAIHELDNHRSKITSYSTKDISNLGRKMSLLRICVATIAQLKDDNNGYELNLVQDAFQDLATGIQLLDDLTDWKEDLEAENMTVPLTLANLRAPGAKYLECEDITNQLKFSEQERTLLLMVYTGAIEDTLSEAIKALKKTIAGLNSIQINEKTGKRTMDFIQDVLDRCAIAKKCVSENREKIQHSIGLEKPLLDLYKLREDQYQVVRGSIGHVQDALRKVAQDS